MDLGIPFGPTRWNIMSGPFRCNWVRNHRVRGVFVPLAWTRCYAKGRYHTSTAIAMGGKLVPQTKE